MPLNLGETVNGWTKKSDNGIPRWTHTATHTSETDSNLATGQFPIEVVRHMFRLKPISILMSWSSATKTTSTYLSFANECTVNAKTITLEGAQARSGTCEAYLINPTHLFQSLDGAVVETAYAMTPVISVGDLSGSGTGTPVLTVELFLLGDIEPPAPASDMGDMYGRGY